MTPSTTATATAVPIRRYNEIEYDKARAAEVRINALEIQKIMAKAKEKNVPIKDAMDEIVQTNAKPLDIKPKVKSKMDEHLTSPADQGMRLFMDVIDAVITAQGK